MNKVEKVSIGNIAFTLEEGAFLLVDQYLKKLLAYYSANESGQEIIDGIEERMAELFIEKLGKDVIVTRAVAQEVVDILGEPEAFDEQAGAAGQKQAKKGRKPGFPARKFYRDIDEKVVGGVFSGFGAYFNIDPVLLRVIYVGAVVLFYVFHFANLASIGSALLLLYLVLWAVVPPARTVAQKCALRGDPTSVFSIQQRVETGCREERAPRGRKTMMTVGNVLLKGTGLLLTIVGISGILSLTLAVTTLGLTLWGYRLPFELIDYFLLPDISAGALTWLKVLALMVVFLPFIGMLYGGIVLLFGLRSPRWRPGLIIFIVWFISAVSFIIFAVGISSRYWKVEQQRTLKEEVALQQDTLYVEFAGCRRFEDYRIWLEADRNKYKLMYFSDGLDRDFALVKYPEFRLRKDDRYKGQAHIQARRNVFLGKMSVQELQERENVDFYRFDGRTLTILPRIYDKDRPFNEWDRRILLEVGENVAVIVKDPIFHQFKGDFEYTNIPWMNF